MTNSARLMQAVERVFGSNRRRIDHAFRRPPIPKREGKNCEIPDPY